VPKHYKSMYANNLDDAAIRGDWSPGNPAYQYRVLGPGWQPSDQR